MNETTKCGRFGATIVFLVLCQLVLTTGAAAQSVTEKVDSTRGALEKWVETRRIISKEKKDWDLGREVLADRTEIIEREIAALRERIADAQKSIDEAEKKKAELAGERDGLRAAVATVKDLIPTFEQRLRKLMARLPEPALDRVRVFAQRMPEENATDIKFSLSERFATVIVMLNTVNKFNREISTNSEVMTLGDGRSAEVATLYLGLGQGYYVAPDGKTAGIGTADEKGWIWTAANDLGAAIGRVIGIYKGEQGADFVPLPVRIK